MSTIPDPQLNIAPSATQDAIDADDGLQLEFVPAALTGKRLLAEQAMRLLMHLDKDLIEARAQWNQNWFRRVMRARRKAVLRLRRRWAAIHLAPPRALGKLRRRFHANIAMHLYHPMKFDPYNNC